MPILGIDYDKCTLCKECMRECVRRFIFDELEQKIIYQDPTGTCMLCGHCIAICPENAILYEGFKDEVYEFEGINELETIIPYNNLHNFVRAHRSIRYYKRKSVPPEILKKVIDVMQYAPSGNNMRSEKYTIISDPVKIKKLSDTIIEVLLADPSERKRNEKSFEARKQIYDAQIFFDAPHIILVSSVLDIPLENFNLGISITYGRLAAQTLGLGTCWVGYAQMAADLDKRIFKVAGIRGYRLGAFAIGYPSISYKRCPPRPHRRIKGL